MGLVDPSLLDDAYRSALGTAADVLIDSWSMDVRGTPPSRPIDPAGGLASDLPDKHRHRYDGRFAVRFLGELLIVVDRLSDPRARGPICTSTAQELAFRALVETAIGCLDEGADSQPLLDFYDQSVEDTDIELLFDPALDGLEDPEAHVGTSPPVNLEFDRWFDRFGGQWPDPDVDGGDER